MKYTSLVAVLFSTLFFGFSSHALQALKIATGHYLAYESYFGAGKENPTLVLLPGINRGLDLRDDVIQQLKRQKKFNFISYHSSLHPESLKLTPANETSYLLSHDVTSADLANEVLTLVTTLKVKNPVYVSLSYSSVISTELAKAVDLKFLIEVAPMIRFDEADPEGSQTMAFWKNWFNLFPGVGNFWAKSFIRQAYSQYWAKRVEEIVQGSPDLADIKNLLVQGYTQLSMVSDGFDYREQEFSQNLKRYYILAENEDPERWNLQLEAIAKYNNQTGLAAEPYVISQSGHIIPSDAPHDYIETIRKILKREKLIN